MFLGEPRRLSPFVEFVGPAGYSHCVDTSNNNVCDTMWWPNGGATSKLLTDLAPGTYYWQVKDTTGLEFNNGVWWSFTVGAPVTSFNKVTPGSGGILTTNNAPLSWTTAPGASFYEICVDTINNHICDTSWVSAAQATTRTLTGLTDGTYYWQVRATTPTGNALADGGTWWSFTIDAPDPIREYIYLGGSLLASLTLTTPTPVLTYYHADVLGSVRAITSATGAPLARHDYFPFGESTSPLTGDPRRFTGLERDAESAFDYASARYYRNVWGRFGSVDPLFTESALIEPQRWNRYAYALNGPLRFIDPTGLSAEEVNGNRLPNIADGVFDLDSFVTSMSKNSLRGWALEYQSGDSASSVGMVWVLNIINALRPAATRIVGVVGSAVSRFGSWLGRLFGAGGAPTPQLGSKLDYFLGRATGSGHNVERSTQMLRQLESIGLRDTPATRQYLTEHLAKALADRSSVIRTAGDRVVRESLLMGPHGGLKFETVWQGDKLITGIFYGGR